VIAYCKLFPTHKIIGMIDLGGMPIRFFEGLKQSVMIYYNMTLTDIENNIDELFRKHT